MDETMIEVKKYPKGITLITPNDNIWYESVEDLQNLINQLQDAKTYLLEQSKVDIQEFLNDQTF